MKRLKSILILKASPAVTAALIFLLLVGIGALAFVAITATGDITVEENLSFVGESTFSVALYPQESETAQLTIANASTIAMIVDLLATIIPDPGNKGLSVEVPNNVTVPASGQVTVDIVITAGKSAEAGVYSITIEIDR